MNGFLEPFSVFMNVSANSTQVQYAVAMEKKVQASAREQGEQAVKLIQASSPRLTEGTGTNLNVVA